MGHWLLGLPTGLHTLLHICHRIGKIGAGLALLAACSSGQLITNVNAIPKTGKPPVVFLNGYQGGCEGTTFQGTFGAAHQVLQADGRASLFFDNCLYRGASIEALGNNFREFLKGLQYAGGEAVPQVDVVAHSMGGLIVRSYLSGKQPEEGVFTPPAETRVRKIVFVATPHFGTGVASLLGSTADRQIQQLQTGSTFVFDLATWNQGQDDLRGVDAISVLGDGGNGAVGLRGFDDSVTSLTSGSLGFFALQDRTRILPYCHTSGLALQLGCISGALPIAQLNSASHMTAQILLSFLNDTQAWRTVGQSITQHPQLSTKAGLVLRYKDANDRTQMPQSVRVAGLSDLSLRLPIAFSENLPAGTPLQLTLRLPNAEASLSVPLTAGFTRAVAAKAGPNIAAIYPSPWVVFPRAAAPGSLISIYGSQLTALSGDTEVNVAGQRMAISFAGPDQINTLVPENVSGLVKVQVKNAAGEHTVNLLIEPTVPSLFAPALNAVTGTVVTAQSPLRPGDYVSLFATGLGRTTTRDDGLNWADVQPEVSFGSRPCTILYAGRAPGFPGLDQINCQISTALQPSDAVPIQVRSGARVSNVTILPVR